MKPFVLQFPVVRNPHDGQEYIVVLDAPEFDRQPGVTLENVRVIGISRERKYVQFTVSKKMLADADKRRLTFHQTELTPQIVQAPDGPVLAGSKIKAPWRVAFTMLGKGDEAILGLCVFAFGSATHYSVMGVKRDGTPIEVTVSQPELHQANQNPVWFVEVESDRAPLARGPESSLII